jgi:hypothetical protein
MLNTHVETWRLTGVRMFVLNESTRGCVVSLMEQTISSKTDSVRVHLVQGASPTDVKIAFQVLYAARQLWAPHERFVIGGITPVWTVPITYYADLSYGLLDSFLNTTNRSGRAIKLRWKVPPDTIVEWKVPAGPTDLDASEVMKQLWQIVWPERVAAVPVWPTNPRGGRPIEFQRIVQIDGFRDPQCSVRQHWLVLLELQPLAPHEQHQLELLLPQHADPSVPVLSQWSNFIYGSREVQRLVAPIAIYDIDELNTLLARYTMQRYKLSEHSLDPLLVMFGHVCFENHDKPCPRAVCRIPVNIACAPGRASGSGLTALHLLIPRHYILDSYLTQWLGIEVIKYGAGTGLTLVDGRLKSWSCDNCGISPIIGPRFHCTLCPDSFDLCRTCHDRVPAVTTNTHAAAHHSSLQMIPEQALRAGLHVSSTREHQEARLLVTQTFTMFDDNGFTALHTAAFAYPDSLAYLLRLSTVTNLFDVTVTTKHNGLSLMACAARGVQRDSIVALLGDARTKEQVRQGDAIDGALPVHHLLRSLCTERGSLVVSTPYDAYTVFKLLAAAPDTINAVTRNGDTVLHLATRIGDAHIVSILLGFGVKPYIVTPAASLSASVPSMQIRDQRLVSSSLLDLAFTCADATACNYIQGLVFDSALGTHGEPRLLPPSHGHVVASSSMPIPHTWIESSDAQMVVRSRDELCLQLHDWPLGVINLIAAYRGITISTAQDIIFRARRMATDLLRSLNLPHRLPPLHCINEAELIDRNAIDPVHRRTGLNGILSKAQWRDLPVIVKSVLFTKDERNLYREGVDMGDPERIVTSDRIYHLPQFEREVMFYMLFAALFPGTVPHIHGIVQVCIITS